MIEQSLSKIVNVYYCLLHHYERGLQEKRGETFPSQS